MDGSRSSRIYDFALELKKPGSDEWETLWWQDWNSAYFVRLLSNTNYSFRVTSRNGLGSVTSDVLSFTTPIGPADDWFGFHEGLVEPKPLGSLAELRDVDGLTYLEKYAYGLRYVVEGSDDLIEWEEVTGVCSLVSLNDEWELVCIEDPAHPAQTPFRALRIKIIPAE